MTKGDTGMLGKLQSSIAGVAGGIGIASIASGLGSIAASAGETQDAINKLGATTGKTGQELTDLANRGKQLYQQGIGESIADAINKTGLLQKTLAMGETNCEFQVLKIDKIVRPVVISPIEIV